jgi:hypothetical protein
MPYIPPEDRDAYDEVIQTLVEDFFHAGSDWKGHMNYVVSSIIAGLIDSWDGPRYSQINDLIGVLECIKLELYRRIAAPYEDIKAEENGDVYNDGSESDEA